VICPACGHKNEKLVFTPGETRKPDTSYIKKEKSEFKEKKSEIKEKKEKSDEIKTPGKESPVKKLAETGKKEIKKEDFYRKALSRLEKSLYKGKKEKKSSPAAKILSFLATALYSSRISYLVWFFAGLTTLTLVSRYHFGPVGWLGAAFTILFTPNIQAEAELLNVHHRMNDFISAGGFVPGSFFILNADILFFIPVLSCIFPLMVWVIKRKARGIETAVNSNIIAGLIFSLILTVTGFVFLRSVSFNYLVFDIILAAALFAPVLDLGILIYVFKPGRFRTSQAIVVLLYNIGIPNIFIVISMVYDYISLFV
jgi:hypothetical protein